MNATVPRAILTVNALCRCSCEFNGVLCYSNSACNCSFAMLVVSATVPCAMRVVSATVPCAILVGSSPLPCAILAEYNSSLCFALF